MASVGILFAIKLKYKPARVQPLSYKLHKVGNTAAIKLFPLKLA